MITAIAGRELKSLFLSPLAWSLLAVIQLILSYAFLSQLDQYLYWQPQIAGMQDVPGVTDFIAAPYLATAAFLLLWVSPPLTMRMLSDERRNGTLPLLLSSPVSMSDVILGKFLGVYLFFLIILALLVTLPLSLYAGTSLDPGKLAAGVLGLALVFGAYAAVGLFMSSLTDQPVVAAVSTFGVLILMWIVDWSGGERTEVTGLFHYLSLQTHLQSFLKGLFSTADVVYYLLVIATFLILGIRRLDNQRLTG